MLTDAQKRMIDVAVGTYKYTGSLELDAQREFGLSPTRYWQEVNRLIDTEAAVAYSPAAVARLRARRASRIVGRVRSRILG
ncbi:helix-turn-helix DNA-binding domain protein [Arthrobacter phage Seahorse]|uniref:Helix-turn-helix DNA-binding domain protein n=1 Tax=Arthrobacter phage Seahorse TaxID=2419611 RepID=A0A3G3M4V9_9CAUD|nr:helix-turn-helix DNA-binding domain protein [Arthrobacter phage Seahorse]AYR01540.1 helix-turn-helix DNA-binding domain protein [Arthrobacter phage Seahorse]